MSGVVASLLSGPYSFVLLEVLVIGVQCFLSAVPGSNMRKKLYTKEFFEKNFPEMKGLEKQFGLPDSGSGKFAQKLSTQDWFDLNNAHRGHLNYVEGIALAQSSLLISGLFQPKLTVLYGAAYILGRFFYTRSYAQKGPKGRLLGFSIFSLALIAAAATGAIGTFNAGGGLKGLTTLVSDIASFNLLA